MTKEEIATMAANMLGMKYDNIVKENLHYPKLLAPILKNVVPEYKEYTVEEVINFIIKESISEDPVDDESSIAIQMETEMSSVSEKLVRYDSRFKAINPNLSDQDINIYLHIDLEVQNDYKPSNPSYPIVKRAIYYGAREISSQLGILTNETNYDKIEKVYSIWICNDRIPEELCNTVTKYSINKNDVIGPVEEKSSDYDLLNVIIIRRGIEECDEAIFDYLNAFFASNIDGICKYVNIRDDAEIKEGVMKMTGLGQSIHDKAIQQGIHQGIQQGIQQGVLSTLISLVNDGAISVEKAADKAGMDINDFVTLLKETTYHKPE